MTTHTWGGSRPGAGRKPIDRNDPRVRVTLSLPRSLVERIDAERGSDTRSHHIALLLKARPAEALPFSDLQRRLLEKRRANQ